MTNDSADDEEEYRPTDALAVCRFSYGYGHTENQAIQGALRYAGPFDPDDDDDETVTVAVWKLQADSWQSHSPSGPERGAEQLRFREIEIPAEEADRASRKASNAFNALHRALDQGETAREIDGDGTDDGAD